MCQLASEPGAGSDLASLRTGAVEDETGQTPGWRLAGQKVWTSLARQAQWGICLARTDDGLDHRVELGHTVALATVVSLLGTCATLRSLAGQEPGPESAVAKLVGVRSRQDSAELVVTMLGDRVFSGGELSCAATRELLLTRCLSIAGGTTQVLRNVAGERILGLPRG